MVNKKRINKLNDNDELQGPVVYWMSRDQRVSDNWSLLFSYEKATTKKSKIIVVFNLVTDFLGAGLRHYQFMLDGLKEVEKDLNTLGIEFVLLKGKPDIQIPKFLKDKKAGILITDFDPLKIKRDWIESIRNKINIAFYEVDAHNIVPCKIVSDKEEYSAYTLRPKISRILFDYLEEFPKIKKINAPIKSKTDWQKIIKGLKINRQIKPVDWLKAGEQNAKNTLSYFIRNKLQFYHIQKNNPNADKTSNLSPYLHFGQISSQRIALEILRSYSLKEAKESFLEELITRKELSDNFCFYNKNYDSFEGFPEWAKKTLNEQRKKKREHLYSLDEFEQALTHDKLWNAAQKEMLITGKMHGYMRMYWAKKILEWSDSPEIALETAIYLNDKYSLDGRDPNGYTGIAWSIGGVHDRAWNPRPIFGKIRYMSYNGCKTKFDINTYINKFS
ncbi:deoxyribodipyrimidine photo-lyase [Bacteroidetes/Chlorobi group bacterium ChocPot_Mid]|nr:MAG: deoxyribodipyrimidine photo-lyase [Bacteroidetes/Chlorobi group bacterium ChocPot_Mid]